MVAILHHSAQIHIAHKITAGVQEPPSVANEFLNTPIQSKSANAFFTIPEVSLFSQLLEGSWLLSANGLPAISGL